ncbi:DUF4064 domain-containing protein [Geomicrobium sediminis]|uniref:Membrane protein SpoIIM required for sporulation n=1 Tax=Geomicrobium sediminis TaxID=1347788 RepID=A0ABS2P989_9BACL|nr:DUF4064 domain-containing protein [Geomicrobium sediminis]MBM7631645.1 putative membrane protein SpoIIM required for sporulation [Geomicrobium sediminis]
MKRTGEKILSWIGNVINILMVIVLGFAAISLSSLGGDFEQELMNELQNDPAVTGEDAQMAADMLGMMGSTFVGITWFAVIVMIVGTVLGIIGAIKITNNAKTAGILLLVAGGGMLLLTLGTTLIQSVLLIIAGIMCLARKPRVTVNNEPDPNSNPQP